MAMTQVRMGVGTFKHSTGITGFCIYSCSGQKLFFRPPTAAELIGINRDDYPYDIESATKTGSDGGEEDQQIQQLQIVQLVFITPLTKVRQIASISSTAQRLWVSHWNEAYKAAINLNWSNPKPSDQEVEKANAKLAEITTKQAQVMSRLQDILTKAYPTEMAEKKFS